MPDYKFLPLSLSDWQPTRDTIHKYCLVLGEIRGALTPRVKHWWHINLRPDVTGLITPPVPAGAGTDNFSFKLALDFMNHKLTLLTSMGDEKQIPLTGQSQGEFCRQTLDELASSNIHPNIDQSQFNDEQPGEYDRKAAERFWQSLGQIAMIFEEFKSGLRKESSPVNLWPHHFDMAVVWFSGRLVPDTDPNDEEYADEQMSFGFSTGDEGIAEPYFYISAYPMPEKLKDTPLPEGVTWYTESWQGALLKYDTLVHSKQPKKVLMNYLRTLHEAGEKLMQ